MKPAKIHGHRRSWTSFSWALSHCLSWYVPSAADSARGILHCQAMRAVGTLQPKPSWHISMACDLCSQQLTCLSEAITSSFHPVCHRPYLHCRPLSEYLKPQWNVQFDGAEVLLENFILGLITEACNWHRGKCCPFAELRQEGALVPTVATPSASCPPVWNVGLWAVWDEDREQGLCGHSVTPTNPRPQE